MVAVFDRSGWFNGFRKFNGFKGLVQRVHRFAGVHAEFEVVKRSAIPGTSTAPRLGMGGARSHEELIVWQLAYELKVGVYELIRTSSIRRDLDLCHQLRSAAGAAPRLVAEGFGRYLPGDFARYLRTANGELKETFDALRDAVDRGYVSQDQIVPLQRLSKRASKAASGLIKYLRTATAPNERSRRPPGRRTELREPPEPPEPHEPPEPPEPPEPRNQTHEPPEPIEPTEPE